MAKLLENVPQQSTCGFSGIDEVNGAPPKTMSR
jgi:hypothetical protein